MDLKKLSHVELDLEIKNLYQRERELLSEILLHIQECDQRRLFLEMGYPNLFSYLTKHIGYSEGAAQRRIDAARLMTEIPEVREKLETGKIQLSHISMIQKASRKTKAPREIKAEALKRVESKCYQQSERIVADIFDLPVLAETKCTQQKDESVRIELTFTKAQAEKLEKVKEHLSHLVPDGNVAKIFDLLLTQKLAATVAVENARKLDINRRVRSENKTLTPKTRKIILERDQRCQFKSPITGKICGSKWQLQVDHIHSRWAGGSNASENLKLFCGQHNRHKYRQEAGIRLQ